MFRAKWVAESLHGDDWKWGGFHRALLAKTILHMTWGDTSDTDRLESVWQKAAPVFDEGWQWAQAGGMTKEAFVGRFENLDPATSQLARRWAAENNG